MKLLKMGLKTEPGTDMKPTLGMQALCLAHAERLFSGKSGDGITQRPPAFGPREHYSQ